MLTSPEQDCCTPQSAFFGALQLPPLSVQQSSWSNAGLLAPSAIAVDSNSNIYVHRQRPHGWC